MRLFGPNGAGNDLYQDIVHNVSTSAQYLPWICAMGESKICRIGVVFDKITIVVDLPPIDSMHLNATDIPDKVFFRI